MILPRQGQRIVWLVRLLASIGLTMVIITTVLLGWTLARVRSERARALATQEPLNRASEELRQRSVESSAEIRTVLDESSPQTNQAGAVVKLVKLVHLQLSSSPDPAVLEPLARLDGLAKRLAYDSARANAWRTNYLPVWEDLRAQRTMSKLRDLISQMRNAIESFEGRHRLDEAVKYRHWQNSAGEEASAQAQAILLGQGRQQSHDTADLKNQLSEFARLVELLGGEEQFDSLADLRDNQLKPVLDRLGRSTTVFTNSQNGAAMLPPQMVENFKTVLFGEGYASDDAHQNIQPGRGGLFTLRQNALRLRREREKLKIEIAAGFQEIEAANASFAQSTQIRTAALTKEMEKNLVAGWRQMLVLGSSCSLLFVWLAWFISRGVQGQVNALEQARAEAEAGRITTQKLMLEQQAAAAELAVTHKQLQVSEQRQELIFNSITEGIYWIDREGRITFKNPAAARMLGWEDAELLGRSAHSTMHHTRADGSSYPQSDSPIYGTMQTGVARHVDNEVFWRNEGASFPVEYTSTPVRNEQGEIMGVVVVFADISARKCAESELQKIHKELLETSRRAGMAEVATGVLHNVGNVLNSVNISSTLVASNLSKSKASTLYKVVALLREREADLGAFITTDPKGKLIPGYLAQLADLLADEQSTALKELGSLQKNIDHIKDIVAMQQSYAKVSGVAETVKITDLIEDALGMNVSSMARHDVQIHRQYGSHLPEISVEKQKVLQILVNLIRNAEHACDHSGFSDKHLTLSVTNGGDLVRVSVADNGVGIPPENLTRIFNHGFTTKKDGHGFGLHSGALAAREMGGNITVHSEGTGKGAVFTLELPISRATTQLEATKKSQKNGHNS